MRARFNVLRAAVLAAAVAMLALPASANAAIIVFDQSTHPIPGGGTVDFNGTNYIGTDIVFESINFGSSFAYCDAATSGPAKCLLDFDTSNGTFVLTAAGGLYDDSGFDPIVGTTGSILTGTIATFNLDDTNQILNITGTDTKDAQLLEYFGITDASWTFLNTEIGSNGGFPEGDPVNVANADITNSSIPEPGLLALFGLGLVGLGRRFTRRQK